MFHYFLLQTNYFILLALLGSAVAAKAPIQNAQFLKHQVTEGSPFREKHIQILNSISRHNITVDKEKMCSELCSEHRCSAADQTRAALCSIKEKVENEFRNTRDASRTSGVFRSSGAESPTIFDFNLLEKVTEILDQAFLATFGLQYDRKSYGESGKSERYNGPESSNDRDVSSMKPFQDTWSEQINAQIQAIADAENEARFFAEEGLGHDIASIERLSNETKLEIEAEIHASLKTEESPMILPELNTGAISEYSNKNPDSVHQFMDATSWNDAFSYLEGSKLEDAALHAIRALPLKQYRILHDTKKDLRVSQNERRTRTHVGVIDGDVVDKHIPLHAYIRPDDREVDSSMLFWYNLKAIATLAKKANIMVTKNRILGKFTDFTSSISRIFNASLFNSTLEQIGVRSLAQVAVEAAALDANVSEKIIESRALAAKHDFRMREIYQGDIWRLSILTEQDESGGRISSLQNAMESERANEKLLTNAHVDFVTDAIALIGNILSLNNRTKRELFLLREAAKSEAILERAKVEYEAREERENESSTLKRVQAMGEAATRELVKMIQIIFHNFAQGIIHTFYTRHGRSQFLLFASAAALLAFSLVLSKELVMLFLSTLQMLARTPNIVREYGNLTHLSRRKSLRSAKTKVVLPPEIMQRIEKISKANKIAHKQGSPMRHVVLCGKSGTGKSLVATTMAKYKINLPYAVMSGADVSPLGRRGPLELRRLLNWANTRPNGAVIIIDEAESALGSRVRERSRGDANRSVVNAADSNDFSSEADGIGYARDTLNVLLSLTGCPNVNFMLILTTSHPEKLDEAILDRMDEMIELPFPGKKERRQILENEFYEKFRSWLDVSHYFSPSGQIAYEENFKPEILLEKLSNDAMTKGFSGREIEKIILAVASSVYARESNILNKKDWDEVTDDICRSMAAKKTKTRGTL